MGKECVVFGCTNRDTDKQLGLKFHRIHKNEPRRALWLKAIRRQDPASGKPGLLEMTGQEFVAIILLKTSLRQLGRYNRANKRSIQKAAKRLLEFQSSNREEAAVAMLGLLEYEPQIEEKENKVKSNQHDTCIKLLAEANSKIKQNSEELNRLTIENSELKEVKCQLRFVQLSEEEIKFYTGLPSISCYQWLLGFVMDVLPKSTMLDDSDILLLTLMKIRLNPPQKDLASRFKISESSITSYIHTAIPALAKKLTFLIHWPAHDELMDSRLQCFKDTYPKCVSIIDCTEVFIAAPADFEARNATYSTYKHTHTVKFLVSITPAGAVSFVSNAYPGKISDKVLTNDCGYLDFIERGDLVLADRRILIAGELNELGAELVIPAFIRGKSQLSERDVERGRKISNVRIHVERAMERLKNLRILSERMHSNMVPHADSIMTISAAIMNLHPSLVN